ncbi:MAG: LacI family DNA-binding transcriptional regulator [Burkholderiales bacterium]|nr:LacI family DNA-binding transcriptional regulator [Burkholderiales bacterium]MDE2396986.1 LacI family DNA-binding transcriptional regulator [Burkholderiales bacterium]MDE2455919.1 LacI family DNA-binding transcriptional regulator [Burkholderiales bacterium]
MADIAARVGVSKMTVSRALNRGPSPGRGSSQALRQRILEACAEMGYVIDQTARTFSSKRSGFVAAVIPSLNNSNFSDTAHGLSAAVEGSGLQLLLGYSDYRVENEERLVASLLMRRPEGVILTGGSHTEATRKMLRAAGVPVVETWDLPAEPIEHAVGFSNAEATAALVRQLHAQGYRRIAFIGGTSNRDTRGADRRRGYAEAIKALGLGEGRVISFGQPPISMDQGAEAMTLLMRQWPEVDAVVCVSDLSAFGALAQCQRSGWKVPERIAIAGFGDFEVARSCHPRITTVAIDCVGIGQAAGELLLRAIHAARGGERLPPETVMIPFRVEMREST